MSPSLLPPTPSNRHSKNEHRLAKLEYTPSLGRNIFFRESHAENMFNTYIPHVGGHVDGWVIKIINSATLLLYDLSRHGVSDDENGYIDDINSYADNRAMLHIADDHALRLVRLETKDHVKSISEPARAFRHHRRSKKGDYSTSGHNDINRVVVGVYVSGIQISTVTVAAVTA